MMSASSARRPSLVAAAAPGPSSSTSPTTPDASPLWIDPKSPRASLARVEQFLAAAHAQSALFDDATIRAMHVTLPALCSALFGSSKVLGWMHMPLPPDTERAITRFLDPTSLFFAYLLDLANDRQWVYAIHHDKLPDPTAHALRDGNLDALPDLYHARLAGASSTSTQVPPLFGKSYVELGTAANTSAYAGDPASLAASTSSFLGRTGSFLVAPTTALSTALPTVTFNMFEFFAFYFAWALANGKKAGARAPSISSDTPTSPASFLPFGSASSKQSAVTSAAAAAVRPDMRVSTWYIRILRAYLSYFLPTSTTTSTAPPSAKARRAAAAAAAAASAAAHHADSAPSAADTDAATASPLRHLADMASYVTSAVRGRFTTDTAGSADAQRPALGYFAANVFGRMSLVPGGGDGGDYDRAPSRAGGLAAESLAASQFFVGCLVECWLNQNAYVPPVPVVAGQPRGLDFAMLSYHSVPVDVLKGLQELVAHVSSVDLLSVLDTSVPAHFLTMNLSRFSGDVSPEKMSHIALKYAYQLLSPTIYRFLRMGTRHYAVADRSLYHLVQIWLKWITPTARGTSLVTIGDDLTARHHQFVAENFLAYSHVLVAFLDRACTFDLGVRERSPVQGAGATYVRTASEAGILYAVLDVFAPMSKQPVQRPPAPAAPAPRRRERKTSYLALGNQRVDALWRSNAQLDAARRMGEHITSSAAGATVADALVWVRSFERVLVERSRRLHGGGAGVPASTVQLVQVLGDTIARLEGRAAASEYEPVLAQEMARPDGSARMLLQLVVRAESDRRWLLHRDGGSAAPAAATSPATPARNASATAGVGTASPLGQITGRVTSAISGYARTLAATSAGALSATVRPGGGRATPRIPAAQLDEERIYYDRIAGALCATFDIPDDEYAAICAQIDADAAAPAPNARAWGAAATDEPVAASLPAYVQDMTADKWHLAPSARIQLKHGMRKAPAVPRLAPGMVDRHLYFTSEVPAVVEGAYWVTDAWHAAVLKGRRAVRRKRAEMEARVSDSTGIVEAWTHRAKMVPVDVLLAVLDFLAAHPMTMRFTADRKFLAWMLVAVHLFVLGWRGWIVLGMMVVTVVWVLAYDFDRTPLVPARGRQEEEVDIDEDADARRRRIVAVRSRATTMDTVASDEL
ncbi:hypothetical protein AMAG_05061 [Allomyces macrogynus ATCC 38327]|uniref:Sphingomyelin phosphodiesterase 4 n=1 Tax=Allomyces macrogynus (strain ATCC 38327) TaxID=578462 RepID=A0A0L0S6M5_ALLM3|nr:hypothetical protein AMAG_05061 [Allomyces macrogynus ATCC 38327]|eukprot:KNE58253.1 hypothetical protein AMAG_05061 [Allomyces macrogynus ATCC 38327]